MLKNGCLHRHVTHEIAQEGPQLGLMLCCHCFEILHTMNKSPTSYVVTLVKNNKITFL